MIRFGSVCAFLLLFAYGPPAWAQDACTPSSEQVSQRDGARLRLNVRCVDTADAAEDAYPSFAIEYAAPGSDRFRHMLALDRDDFGEPIRAVSFVDIDGDGMHEVEARGMCGAGPNCLGDLYRWSEARGELVHFFSGGYSDLRYLDGHLVESGRASCCSWEYHAWRMDAATASLRDAPMDWMITVGAGAGAGAMDEGNDEARCTFSRRSGDNWRVAAPPGPQWLSLCEVYGDTYHLVTPEEAQAADAAAQEQ